MKKKKKIKKKRSRMRILNFPIRINYKYEIEIHLWKTWRPLTRNKSPGSIAPHFFPLRRVTQRKILLSLYLLFSLLLNYFSIFFSPYFLLSPAASRHLDFYSHCWLAVIWGQFFFFLQRKEDWREGGNRRYKFLQNQSFDEWKMFTCHLIRFRLTSLLPRVIIATAK